MMTPSDVVAIRDGLRMTQAQFAAALGVSLKAAHSWEHGATITLAKEQRIRALAAAHGTPGPVGLDAYTEIDLLTELIRRSATRMAAAEQAQTVPDSVLSVMSPGGDTVNGDEGVGSIAARGTRQDQQAEREADAAPRTVRPVKGSQAGRRQRGSGGH